MAASTLDDNALAQAFAERSDAALAEAYRRYGDLLHSVARSASGGSFDAPDCVHDALLRVWRLQTYRLERGALRSFLMVCVRNEALSRRRAAARQLAVQQREARLAAHDEGEPLLFDHVESARLRRALAALPAEQRTVIELAYFGGRTQTQIAGQLDVPLGTVKSRAALALRKLALALRTDSV